MSSILRRRFIATGMGVVGAVGIAYLTKDHWLWFVQDRFSPSSPSSPLPTAAIQQSTSQYPEPRDSNGPAIQRIEDVTKVCKLTGYDSINKTQKVAIYGTDLGIMTEFDGHMYFAFGDTFNADRRKESSPSNYWRSNTLAKTGDFNAQDGIVFDSWITDYSGKAKEILLSEKVPGREHTVIPTAMISAGKRLYVHFMSVKQWGQPGEWIANYSGLAYSDDKGNSFTKDIRTRWGGGSNFVEVAFSKIPSENNDGTYDILMWGTPAGRFGSIKLAKVNETKLLEKDQYRYYAGIENSRPQWAQDQSSAVTVIDAPAGEMSVQYNEFLDRWIITYLRQNPASSEIVLREGENPWGPWSYPRALMSGDMYGPFMHSRYFENRGEQVYFTLSSWSEYNVYLYGITLVKRK